MNKKKRFVALKNYKGIRKDLVTGKYVARKTINKKEYSESFSRISDAVQWRSNFHPLLTSTEISKNTTIDDYQKDLKTVVQTRHNGVDQRFTFADVWELYKKQYFPNLEQQTIDDRLKFARYFFPDLMPLKMTEITPELLDAFMEKQVAKAKAIGHRRRKNFDNDLKCLKAILNWYRENYDGMFIMPVLKRHKVMGIIKKMPKRNSQKMTLEQVQLFLDSFEDQFWRDFAEIHFFMAGRSQEIGGMQWENVNFAKGLIRVSDVSIWGENKRFTRLKEIPKNGEERIVYLNTRMKTILMRRQQNKSNKLCPFFRESTGERLSFVFEIDGVPVSYRSIQYHYNKALKKAGLYAQFKSTHILRKAMANIVRQEMGLDAAQAAGGWKSREVVEKTYTDAPDKLNKEAVDFMEKMVVGGVGPDTGNDDFSDRDKQKNSDEKLCLRLVENKDSE
jgi:integrase